VTGVPDDGQGTAPESADLVARAVSGQAAAVARALTELELGSARALALIPALWRLAPRAARIIGVTGAAGVGKSTLVSRMVAEYAGLSARPAVLAIDPSSETSGGSFLGDRIRMTELAPAAFVRSLPNRAVAGGLAPAAAICVAFLVRCGFDPVIIETVGVGQSEISVSRIAQTTVTCLAPGLGDRIQAAKAGLMESADIFVITKSDLPAADTAVKQVLAMANLGQRAPGSWRRPVCAVSAVTGDGVTDLVAKVSEHQDWARRSGRLETSSQALAAECVRWAVHLLTRSVPGNGAGDTLRIASADVAAGRTDPVTASRRLLAAS
jgi:LAO/AO transport system kinase